MVDAMTSAVEAMEAMLTAVEMREWLEVGRPETERITAVHFFSRGLAYEEEWPCDEEGKMSVLQVFPLYWPGHIPGLVQGLADCLRPHNSKAIQSGAMHALKHIVCLRSLPNEPVNELFCESHASEHLSRLAHESNCTEIRDQALWLLGRMTLLYSEMYVDPPWSPDGPPPTPEWNVDFVYLIANLICKYAAIEEPTDTDLFSLNNVIEALKLVTKRWILKSKPFLEILPVLISIFHEPEKRKSVRIPAGGLLAAIVRNRSVANPEQHSSILESGLPKMLLEMLRVGTESSAVLFNALRVLQAFMCASYTDGVVGQKMLDMGVLDVMHLVLKRPNVSFKLENHWGSHWFYASLWYMATTCIGASRGTGNPDTTGLEAVLNQEGLMELMVENALGLARSPETHHYHCCMSSLLHPLHIGPGTEQIRQLMWKPSFFHLLSHYLNDNYSFHPILQSSHLIWNLEMLEACLGAADSVSEKRILRRLIDSTGITDALHRISYYPEDTYWGTPPNVRARNILDTYLSNPLPPPPHTKLPAIIYTRNAPY